MAEAGTGERGSVVTITDAERLRLEALEAALIRLRNIVAATMRCGLDGNRVALERAIGVQQAVMSRMADHGDISQDACVAHASEVYRAVAIAQGRRS